MEVLSAQQRYINREVSWLEFNYRVLAQTTRADFPLYERIRFLAISATNLDEFISVRIAGLKNQISHDITIASIDERTPSEQLEIIQKIITKLIDAQQRCLKPLLGELRKNDIRITAPVSLKPNQCKWLSEYYDSEIFPVLSPIAVDPAHPFPFIPNKGICFICHAKRLRDGQLLSVLIPLPEILPRFIPVAKSPGIFVQLEAVISWHFAALMPGCEVLEEGSFRIMRDSDFELEDEADDFVRSFENALKQRRYGSVISCEINKGMGKSLSAFLCRELDLQANELFRLRHMVGLAACTHLTSDRPLHLNFKHHQPRMPQQIRDHNNDCFAAVRAQDIMLHHPYESFDVVVQFLTQAAQDDKVVAIKQTLYRTGKNSPIVKALILAAEAGKSVTALIELKARFDEEHNIQFARNLERAGVNVSFGFVEMKTHAKVTLVVRRENKTLVSYAHFGTGNYHPLNACSYSDLSFFTKDPVLCRDAGRLFNYVTGNADLQNMEDLRISPAMINDHVMTMIRNETENAKTGKKSGIWIKVNSIADSNIITCLYEASCAGVPISLIVRGICCVRPNIPDLSQNIYVKSIAGRFLEHSRIYCFGNGHDLPSKHAHVYIGSSDLMTRNLHYRVETMVPIKNPHWHDNILNSIMKANLADTANSWELQSDGSYARVQPHNEENFDAHRFLCNEVPSQNLNTAYENFCKQHQIGAQ